MKEMKDILTASTICGQIDKKILRRELIEDRDSIEPDLKKIWDDQIFKSLINDEDIKNARSIFVFYSFGSEIYTLDFIDWALSENKTVAIPKIYGKEMKAVVMDELKENKFGILEPVSDEVILPEVSITPALIYDQRGYRIGYGGGYYDRYYEKTPCKKIGIIYPKYIVDELKPDKYDIAVDKIIS